MDSKTVLAGIVGVIALGMVITSAYFLIDEYSSNGGSTNGSTSEQLVGQWSGGNTIGKQTESFTIDSTPWKIVWECTAQPGASFPMFSMIPMDTTNPNRFVAMPVMFNSGGSDITYAYETGTFYLAITATSVDWSVKVYK